MGYIKIPYDVFGRNNGLSAYVLDPVRQPICRIYGITKFDVSPKFNDISEISFEVQRFVTNTTTLEWEENESYKYIRAFAQIYIPELGDRGYFIINEEPTISVESTRKESKSFIAMSYESILEHESLVGFSINCGTVESKEMFEENLDELDIPQNRIRLYDANNPKLSLLDWVLKDDYYGWQVGHVDTSIAGLERSFEVDNQNVYSFLHADVSKAFRCIFDFDTKHKLINVYDIETVGNNTNVYLSIEHFLKQIQISPHSDMIYTVFNVQGDGELGIENVNFGSEKIINIDYPLSLVSEDLLDKYKDYEAWRETRRQSYINLNKQHGDIMNKMTALLDRQPQDEVNNQWSSTIYYSLDDLTAMLGAYREICAMIESMYKESPESPVDYTELNMSADAALYYSYKEVCIPDIESEIRHRQTDGVEDATSVEQEFVWELYGLNDLMNEAKSLEERIANYVKQGYDGSWEDSGYLDQDEFNAHHNRYLLLNTKLVECNEKISIKTAQYEQLKEDLESVEESIEELGQTVTLEGSGMFTAKEIAQIKELYRESDYTNSNFLITEYDDIVSETAIQEELYNEAEKQLQKESRPQYEWSVTSNDLYAMKEFAPLKEQLQIGDFVWLGRNDQGVKHWTIPKQKFRVVGIEFSGLKSDPSFVIKFSTMIETDYDRNDFEELLDNAISSSVNSMSVGFSNRAITAATNVTNSLIKPYIEILNARIDNAEIQSVTAEDLKATSALIDHLTVFDLMAGEITADKSITLTSREGYGSIVIENSTMKFKDSAGHDRVVIGRGNDNRYQVNIYDANQSLLWGSDGIADAGIANAMISNRMMAWNGIAYGVDTDGRPMWGAEKVMLDGARLPDQWNNLKDELSSVEIVATTQAFIEESGAVTPASITMNPILHILSDRSKIQWFYHIANASTWTPLSGVTGISIDSDHIVTVASSCPLYTSSNNSIVFKAAYVDNNVERYTDVMSIFLLSSTEGTGESAYTIILSNEAQTVATDSNYFPVGDATYSCIVRAFYGTQELTAVSNPSLGTGTFSVTASTTERGARLDYSTPGTINVTMNTNRAISANFDVVLSITIPELSTPISRMISFSASAAGESPVIVQIDSSTGIIFKNTSSSSILTVHVTKGSEDITSQVTKFTWTKRDKNGIVDPEWTRELVGNTLPISADDISGQAVFSCEVSFD